MGDTGRMLPDLGRFLQNAALQKIEPYKAFDNGSHVGICWGSAWLITSPQGPVLIDALYGPYTEPMLAHIRQLALVKGRKPGDAHPPVGPTAFRPQLDALQAGAEKRLQAERAQKPTVPKP